MSDNGDHGDHGEWDGGSSPPPLPDGPDKKRKRDSEDEEGWECHNKDCGWTNRPERRRCFKCSSWRGGKKGSKYGDIDPPYRRVPDHLLKRARKRSWDSWFQDLCDYKDRHGNCRVPKNYPGGLGRFVNKTSWNLKKGLLSEEQVAKLDSINFTGGRDRDKRWHDRLEELRQYHAEHGHFDVPYRHGDRKDLGTWVKTQRSNYMKLVRGQHSKITPDRVKKLQDLGVELESHRQVKVTFDAMVLQLRAYRDKYGHTDMPLRSQQSTPLAKWLEVQRAEYVKFTTAVKRGRSKDPSKVSRLTEEMIQELRDAGVVFDDDEDDAKTLWDEKLDLLKRYKDEFGHVRVSQAKGSEHRSLARWLESQRRYYRLRAETEKDEGEDEEESAGRAKKNNPLTPERIAALDELGVVWNPRGGRPQKKKADDGTGGADQTQTGRGAESNKSKRGKSKEKPSGRDSSTRRKAATTPKDVAADNEDGDGTIIREVDVRNDRTSTTNKRAATAPNKNDDGGMPLLTTNRAATAPNEDVDGTGSSTRKGTAATRKRPAETGTGATETTKKAKTNKSEQIWAHHMVDLTEFHSNQGHCNVPRDYPPNPALANFVNSVRSAYRKKERGKPSSLTEARLESLARLNFDFCPRGREGPPAEQWDAMFRQLQQYKADHGTCNVPRVYRPNMKLGAWVARQRHCYRQLDQMGGDDGDDDGGDKGADEGDPGRQSSGIASGRSAKGKKRCSPLEPERMVRLEALGFEFNPRGKNKAWEERFSELEAYKAAHGNCNVPYGWEENPGLAVWVHHQRNQYTFQKKGRPSTLTKERVRRLRGLQFEFERQRVISRAAAKKARAKSKATKKKGQATKRKGQATERSPPTTNDLTDVRDEDTALDGGMSLPPMPTNFHAV